MGAAVAEDVDVEAVGLGEQQVGLVGDEREALEEADADAAVRDDLRQRQRRGLDVVPALDDLEVGRNGAQVLVRVLVGQVAEAQRLANLAGREELLELQAGGLVSDWDHVRRRLALSRQLWQGKAVPWRESRELGRGCGYRREQESEKPWCPILPVQLCCSNRATRVLFW